MAAVVVLGWLLESQLCQRLKQDSQGIREQNIQVQSFALNMTNSKILPCIVLTVSLMQLKP